MPLGHTLTIPIVPLYIKTHVLLLQNIIPSSFQGLQLESEDSLSIPVLVSPIRKPI